MTESYILELAKNAITVSLVLAGPALLASLIIGSLVSLFQAATQINEVTLTFVPKIIGTGLVVALLGSWMGQQLMGFTVSVFNSLADLPH
jgi:flagellar biosynthetic protein FliQ